MVTAFIIEKKKIFNIYVFSLLFFCTFANVKAYNIIILYFIYELYFVNYRLVDGYYIGGSGLRCSQADRTKVLCEGER